MELIELDYKRPKRKEFIYNIYVDLRKEMAWQIKEAKEDIVDDFVDIEIDL
jgi:hypothetical protein